MIKQYIIFAGVNGAGKSTLYQTNSRLLTMPRINVDEIVREYGDWQNEENVLRAGKVAAKKINEFFKNEISFNQETTLCGKSILRNIQRAINLGYKIELYYVGLDSAETAKHRVKIRVAAGGHGIPEKDIERRYYESLEQLKVVLPYCDRVEIYDNTKIFTKVAGFEKGHCNMKNNNIPNWAKDILKHNPTIL